jgi:primase-polymerase (primpol)-like protein
MRVDGRPASSTDSSTWSEYASVAHAPNGVMLGGGLGCYDLDGVLAEDGSVHPDALAVLRKVGRDALWVERSMSGNGLHVFVHAPEAKGIVGERVSFYTQGRFIAVTGDWWSQRV